MTWPAALNARSLLFCEAGIANTLRAITAIFGKRPTPVIDFSRVKHGYTRTRTMSTGIPAGTGVPADPYRVLDSRSNTFKPLACLVFSITAVINKFSSIRKY